MDLSYPPEAEEFRAEIRAWLHENLPEGWFDEGFEMTDEERRAFNEQWPQKLFEGGWICATWPKEYGGQGRSDIEQYIFFDESMRAGAPVPMLTINTVGPTIMRMGSEEQKKEWLPRLATGEVIGAYALTEQSSGSDALAAKTTAPSPT